jgi:hypothetical protein
MVYGHAKMEAKEHIEQLRRQKGVGNSDFDSVAQSLDNALAMLVFIL